MFQTWTQFGRGFEEVSETDAVLVRISKPVNLHSAPNNKVEKNRMNWLKLQRCQPYDDYCVCR